MAFAAWSLAAKRGFEPVPNGIKVVNSAAHRSRGIPSAVRRMLSGRRDQQSGRISRSPCHVQPESRRSSPKTARISPATGLNLRRDPFVIRRMERSPSGSVLFYYAGTWLCWLRGGAVSRRRCHMTPANPSRPVASSTALAGSGVVMRRGVPGSGPVRATFVNTNWWSS